MTNSLVLDERDVFTGRMRILSNVCSAGGDGVREAMAEAERRADDGEAWMTYTEAWQYACRVAQEPGHYTRHSDAVAYVAKVAALADELVVSATDEHRAVEIAEGLKAERDAEKAAARHRAAAALGWRWDHAAVMGAGMTLGGRALADGPTVRAAADQLADAGYVSYRVKSGHLYAYITDAGELAWMNWRMAINAGGYITVSPERPTAA